MDLARVPDLDALELLLLVDATGSLGRAAQARGVGQPAVTARVRTMERLVGFPLIERGPRGSTLTSEGRLVADWARDVLQAAATLDAGIRSLRVERDVRLRVAASLTVAEHLLPTWLVRLAAQRPETAVSLHAMNSTDVAREVGDGSADLGFVEGPQVPTGLDSRIVARDELTVVTHPGHRWARRRRPIDAAELAASRLVQREPTSGTRHALETALRAHAPLAPPLLELSTTSAMRAAVAAGAGPAVLSNLAVDDEVAAGRLVRVPVTGVDLHRMLRAVWRAGQRPAGPARDLLAIAAPRRRGPS